MVEQREQRAPSRRRTCKEAKAAQQIGPPSPTRGSASGVAVESSSSAEKQPRRSRSRASATPPPKALSRKSPSLQGAATTPGGASGVGSRRSWSTGSLRKSGGESSTAASGAQSRDSRHGQATPGFSALVEDVRGEVNALKDLLIDGSVMEGGFEDCPQDTSDSGSVEGLLARIESAFGGILADEESVVLSKRSSPKRSSPKRSSPKRQKTAGDSTRGRSSTGHYPARVPRAVQEASSQHAKAPAAQRSQSVPTVADAAQVEKQEQSSTTVPLELSENCQAATRQDDEEEQVPLDLPTPDSMAQNMDFSPAQTPSTSSPSKSIISTFLWLWSGLPRKSPGIPSLRRQVSEPPLGFGSWRKSRSSSAEAPPRVVAQEALSVPLAAPPSNQREQISRLPAGESKPTHNEEMLQSSAETACIAEDRAVCRSSASSPKRSARKSRSPSQADFTHPRQADFAHPQSDEAQVDDEVQASCTKNPQGHKRIIFDASHSKWEVVQKVALARDHRVVREGDEVDKCTVRWIDDYTIKDCHIRVQPWMRVNHFPGMAKTLGRKCRLARNMTRMKWICPNDFCFLPRTWVLPDDWEDLYARYSKEMLKDKDSAYIVKPDGGAMGRGIFLTNDLETLRRLALDAKEKDQAYAVQKYITRPMLIDGCKFDLRLYVLVSGVMEGRDLEPRIFLFRDGLVRICTTEYKVPERGNLDQVCMHLTNYEVNRFSGEFQMNTSLEEVDKGHKRSLAWLLDYIEETYGAEERRRVWFELVSVTSKTVLAAQPTLEFEYNDLCPKDLTHGVMGCRCFEILGFDVLLTQQRKAMLIEVNHMPSFQIHSPLDLDIKTRVVDQVLDMTCSSVIDQQTYHKMVKQGFPFDSPLQATDNLLELPEYKDFERMFPPRDDCPPELASQLGTILATVRKVYRPVMAGGYRRSSQESSAKESSGSMAASAGVTRCCAASSRPSWGPPPAPMRDPLCTSTKAGAIGGIHGEQIMRLQMRGRSA